jgi:heme-degrading monooxygenase HmoA
MASEHFASGDWVVQEGSDEDFIERWGEWIGARTKSVPGFGAATLMRDDANPQHFVSFSSWDDASSRDTWKTSPEFAKGFAGCRELCEDFQGGDFDVVMSR